ncbi:single-stranded-DNA-specific exonuclease RecJ [Alkalihalobacillus trypoxylicola]|uniref:Single-stranded-DNA-specific exonuclease RecJ n=1 Tax=Alkalihalobacillus trypoxylicola TaxID=519424 RepID=A0A161QND9_9BACI|nr:single-stranded-DNA-specific exonuclease RecJ [Alkalihalobacillus trypoxylicola]KYG31873.1 single-stranded-DNA-specific exonuclease RecJ [Alkalihalobacillus trypoxylicola]
MLNPKARWKVEEQPEELVQELQKSKNLSPLVAKLLINRGFTTAEQADQFLNKQKMNYHDPYLLSGMSEAVSRIKQAIDSNERILIFGDYDADGVSSTAVMVYTFRMLGADFDYYIPNRFTEGYGPNEPALRKAKDEGFSLVVTVDTGIAAVHEADVAKELELDFIITDHHEAPPILPDAYAIINPKKPDCPYPFKGLAGVGVAFKVAHALLGRIPVECLDIAVLGTIADLVPLVDENRLLAMEGLQALQTSAKPGIQAIKKKVGIGKDPIDSEHVGFAIGPRLNAAGRLDSADPAVRLLISDDMDEAEELAEQLDQYNKERQKVVSEITKEAVEMVETLYPPSENSVLIIAQEGWNPGVIGIVASRLVEKYYRPTIVLNIDREKGIAKGSARSIEGFDMFAHLSKSREILPHFGGHPMAAGLTMELEHVDELKRRLEEQAKETLKEEDFIPIKKVDLKTSVDEVSIDIIKQLAQLAPFGVGNPTPIIMLEQTKMTEIRKIGSDSNHLKIQFGQGQKKLDGIGFHLGYLYEQMNVQDSISAVGKLSINEWNGHSKPQLLIQDLAIDSWQLFDWRSVQKAKLAEKLEKIPNPKKYYIAFQEQTKVKLGLSTSNLKVWTPADFDDLNRFDSFAVVLLDLPNHHDDLKKLFQLKGQASEIYSLFYQEEDSFFSASPNREQFKWFYAFLKSKTTFNLNEQGLQLMKFRGWSKDTIQFLITVFEELEFIKNDQGVLTLVESPAKKSLNDSPSFQKKEQQRQLENDFVYSSNEHLKNWFSDLFKQIKQEVHVKERM